MVVVQLADQLLAKQGDLGSNPATGYAFNLITVENMIIKSDWKLSILKIIV